MGCLWVKDILLGILAIALVGLFVLALVKLFISVILPLLIVGLIVGVFLMDIVMIVMVVFDSATQAQFFEELHAGGIMSFPALCIGINVLLVLGIVVMIIRRIKIWKLSRQNKV